MAGQSCDIVAPASRAISGFTTTELLDNYEGGVSGMSLENAWKLANFYGCTLDELGGRVMPGEAE
ncbi:helix-turn-helix domain-containing protein [Enorma massiliensis]|uniref:helix-turn-helix domain-containing protein n=1 Tax=Enorma massiliensis TaxID=1472761 RepID=UPI003A8DD50A